ncbi:hypothetical protein CAPTEDRAFT_199150 [Capitella teleta]|uniref:Uncharacterized protein n=1 Tax=Capitella teleta TaxID=283909 RepID=R7VJR1_CAPTE|nr:hypothetical protein CAPTEDRAFT_199150 [Capitella teleta]|eukprot:ELU16686.1 hypothetical protein CAPTEDRAFT_199150 [Capitella teleta]
MTDPKMITSVLGIMLCDEELYRSIVLLSHNCRTIAGLAPSTMMPRTHICVCLVIIYVLLRGLKAEQDAVLTLKGFTWRDDHLEFQVGYPSKDRVKVYWRDVADGLLVEPQPDGFASSVETEPGVRYSSAISPQMTSSLESVYVINQSKNTFISLDVNEIHTLHWNILKTVPKNTDLRPYESTVIEYGIEVKNAEFTSEDLHVRAFAYPMMESDEWFVPGKDFSFKTAVFTVTSLDFLKGWWRNKAQCYI